MIELLAVIAIIAILFVLLIPQVSSAIGKAKETGIMTDFRSYQVAIQTVAELSNPSEITEQIVNSNLDKDLKFEGAVSNKKNSFGFNYEFLLTGLGISVVTKSDTDVYILNYFFETNNFESSFDNKNIYQMKGDILIAPSVSDVILLHDSLSNYRYVVVNGEIQINSYLGNFTKLRIPSYIDNIKVTTIGEGAFYSRGLSEILLPMHTKKIDKSSFFGNYLKFLEIPNEVTLVNFSAFYANKLEYVKLGDSLTVIENNAFRENNIKTLIFSDKVNSLLLGNMVFYKNNLTELSLPSYVVRIGGETFKENDLRNITINGNTTFGNEMFFDNPNINSVKSKSTNLNSSHFNSTNPVTIEYN